MNGETAEFGGEVHADRDRGTVPALVALVLPPQVVGAIAEGFPHLWDRLDTEPLETMIDR
ncbi:hypothetical protein [Streptomyces sediminimaris]|uniref:hypothetical protein n=1 Tax=Streptomyces sediminimaris TaxID=3383721 RepID=UPI00399BEE41